MKEKELLLQNLGFLVLLILFVLFKYPYLSEPFYWDEAWVYAPALNQMAENGPSLLPNAIDIKYSRGHPMFFHFLGGLYILIFGDSPFSIHSFSLLTTIVGVIATYSLAKYIFNFRVAIIACLFLMTNELFFINSVFAFPEMLLAALSTLGIYYYLLKKPVHLFFALSLMVLTKETSIVLLLVLLFAETIMKVFIKEKINLKLILPMIGSCLVFISIYIMNKIYHDWYFYPGHTEYFNFNIDYLAERIRRISGALFSYKSHWLLSLPILIALTTFYIKNQARYYIQILSMLFFVGFVMFKNYPTEVLHFKILLLGLLLTGIYLLFTVKIEDKKVKSFFSISLIYTFAFISFSAINFFTDRYILCIMPLLVITTASAIHYLSNNNIKIFMIISVLIIGFQINQLITTNKLGGSHAQCYQILDCHKSIAEFIVNNLEDGARIKVDFLMFHHFSNPQNGYYDHSLKEIIWTMWEEYDYIIYENVLSDYQKHFNEISEQQKLEKIFECDAPIKFKSAVYKIN